MTTTVHIPATRTNKKISPAHAVPDSQCPKCKGWELRVVQGSYVVRFAPSWRARERGARFVVCPCGWTIKLQNWVTGPHGAASEALNRLYDLGALSENIRKLTRRAHTGRARTRFEWSAF